MIQSIEIENFRCFEKTEVKGFQRMNLITGKNNSGKTALLEGIYYCLDRNYNSILRESRLANNDADSSRNLFFNQKDDSIISIECRDNEKSYLHKSFAENPSYKSEFNLRFIFDKNRQLPDIQNLAASFDDIFISGKSKIIQESIQKIDTNIAEIRTFSSKSSILFLRKKGEENYLPIYYFGDAIQKIARYIINVISFDPKAENKILLIDEIENGLHYTAQDEFWRMLFKLCVEFNVQLFATTHSLEMIKAYERVASEFEGEAAYFEMARHAKTNQIVGLKHEMDVLEYALETDAKIRGEV